MSSEHPGSGDQQKTGRAAVAPRGEVKARGAALAASTKVRVEAMGMNEREKNSLDRALLESKSGLSFLCLFQGRCFTDIYEHWTLK